MKSKKVTLGQFFTSKEIWLKPQILDFINKSRCRVAYDPFAGRGDLLRVAKEVGFNNLVGLDIDKTLNWIINDSLVNIPNIPDAIIITNPPYLSNYSASRKKIFDQVKKYFDTTFYDDLYLLALDKMLEAQDYIVAIVPETFINSNYLNKNKLVSCTVLEENPFDDTDTPVCVLCFDNKEKNLNNIQLFKNNNLVSNFQKLEESRLKPTKQIPITFNTLEGWLGLRAVDSTNPKDMIRFDYIDNIDYDWIKGIKVSSRLLSIIDIDIPLSDRDRFIETCNRELSELRKKSADLILSPFKGNMKNGLRRRRLDFLTARAILEVAYNKIYGGSKFEQSRLF
jgi:hypothetical protein